MRVTAEGHVVGLVNRGYDFKDDQTGERQQGTSRRLFVANGLGDDPTRISVRREDAIACQAFDNFCGEVSFLDRVRVEVEMTAKGSAYFLAGEVIPAAASTRKTA